MIYGHDLRHAVTPLAEAIKSVAEAIKTQRSGHVNYNIIVNVPEGMDKDEVTQAVVDSIEAIEQKKNTLAGQRG